MKRFYSILALFMLNTFSSTAQDLQVSNIGYDYDFQTAVLSVYFDMENTGTFATFDGVVCEVSIVDLGTAEYVVGSVISDDFGLSGGNFESLGVTNIDLDNISNLPTGEYYVKVCVDVTNIEQEDNESNNCGQNNDGLFFESLTAGLSNASEINGFSAVLYPNPVSSNQLTFSLSETVNESVELTFTNADGKVVYRESVFVQEDRIECEIDHLLPGVYFYTVSTRTAIQNGSFVRM